MKRKILVLFGIICAGLFVVFTPIVCVHAQENEGETVEVQYPCKVVENIGEGGNILLDKTEGDVGDVVTALIKPEFLYTVTVITFNGNEVEIAKDGRYEFTLVEGDNVIAATFVINNEKLTEIAGLINGVRENGFSSLFTVSNLLTLISWLFSSVFSVGFFVTLIRNKKIKAKTTNEVQEAVTNVIQKELATTIKDFLISTLQPIADNFNLKTDSSNETIRVLCRCFVLAQDNTPENRLAIINELTNLNNSDEELTNRIKAIIKEEQKVQEQKIIDRDKAIEDLKKDNEQLIKEEETIDYGQF